jgi:two-component system phosphate regulon sensor histidine kinase PhoR
LESEEAKRFLGIVSRQANRLHAIIEDLLKLSRIEQGIDRGEIELEVRKLRPVLSAAIHSCETQAQAKEMTIRLDCEEELRGRVNAPLLEQAVVNLVDNAVKYGTRGQTITVSGRENNDLTVVTVADEGPGIEKEHLPRLFERFYRVDRARSSSQGGTGLGLAIVKHITISHGGTISVESTIGKGTIFTLKLSRR